MKIKIKIGKVELFATLKKTRTAEQVLAALPCTSSVQTWGQVIYFQVPASVIVEPDAQQVVDPGTLVFWTQGRSLGLVCGPTPISKGTECLLAAYCNILGKLEGDYKTLLHHVRDGDPVRAERI
jgi:uncharacterized protein